MTQTMPCELGYMSVSTAVSGAHTPSKVNERMEEQLKEGRNEQITPGPMTTKAARRPKGHTILLSPARRSHLWEGRARGEVSPAVDTH